MKYPIKDCTEYEINVKKNKITFFYNNGFKLKFHINTQLGKENHLNKMKAISIMYKFFYFGDKNKKCLFHLCL